MSSEQRETKASRAISLRSPWRPARPDGNVEGDSDMFRELMPILNGRQLLLTVSRVDDATLRVCIVPPEKPSR